MILSKPHLADYVLFVSADYFGMSKHDILAVKNKKIRFKQRLIMKVMHDEMGFTIKDITNFLNYKPTSWHTVYNHYRNISEDIANDKELKLQYNQLLNFLNLQNYDKA